MSYIIKLGIAIIAVCLILLLFCIQVVFNILADIISWLSRKVDTALINLETWRIL